jgi:ParB family chromosome partitioning protein
MTKSKNAKTAAAASAPGASEQFIPLNRLKRSPRNARKTPHSPADIEALAASTKAHGILQAPVVEPELKDGKPTGYFLVTIGEGRRQAQLLRVKRKEITKTEPIRCIIETAHDAFEISLAENAVRSPMHPADQFDAFHHLNTVQGQSAEDIAARFGVTPAVVKQRLKLATVSPKLMQSYRDGDLTLDQLTAFAITDDHARQEKVFAAMYANADREDILASLNDEHIPATDARAVFVGKQAYVQAGGAVITDLFDSASDGYFADAALLFDLAAKKLEADAEAIKAEGWKWVMVAPRFDYSEFSECRRVYPEPRALSDAEAEQLAVLEEQYEALEISDDSDEADKLEVAIEALRGEDVFDPAIIARAGAVVTLSHNGSLRVERGFVRPEDDVRLAKVKAARAEGALPEKLIAELTATRTSVLRNALAQHSDAALRAVVHCLAEQVFYGPGAHGSCLVLRLTQARLERHVPDIAETDAESEIAARHVLWAKRLPEDAGQLWAMLGTLALGEQIELLAHCASLALDCVQQGGFPAKPLTAEIASAIGFDMAAHWQPTPENYLGRVSKDRILDAVREGVSKDAADNLATLKKEAMAKAAAERLAGKGWLPAILRNEPASETVREAAE